MKKLIFAALTMVSAVELLAIQGTVRTAKDSKTGDVVWQTRTKSYLVTAKKVSVEYPLADVVSLQIDKPATYDKAVDMISKGQAAAAIPLLTKIVADYKMLTWDKLAGKYLVFAHLQNGDAQKAYNAARAIISEDENAAWQGDLAPAYWQSLLKLGKTTQLENCLRKASSEGDRATSAEALVMRGDIIMTTGDTPEVYRKALIDAYMRVALMYTDEPCRAARASAMNKAASCFDKLGMASRAEALRAQAKQL